MKLFVRIIIWLSAIFIMWVSLSLMGIVGVVTVMFLTRNNPSFNLEMGWMAVVLLVPVVSVFLSPLITLIVYLIYLVFRKSNKNKQNQNNC